MTVLLTILSIFFISNCLAEPAKTLPAFKDGANINTIRACQQQWVKACNDKKAIPEVQACSKTVFGANPDCQQNAEFFAATNGTISTLRNYGNVTVIYADVFAADHSDGYFIIDASGTLTPLVGWLDLTQVTNYDRIAKTYPNVMLTPRALDYPELSETPESGLLLTFEQQLVDGCMACADAGTAAVGYFFDKNDNFVAVKVIGLLLPKVVSRR
tara:strand:- start:32747 stop:33388 length:642 start_codon:yes stop_codon:yes gene_type:complete